MPVHMFAAHSIQLFMVSLFEVECFHNIFI